MCGKETSPSYTYAYLADRTKNNGLRKNCSISTNTHKHEKKIRKKFKQMKNLYNDSVHRKKPHQQLQQKQQQWTIIFIPKCISQAVKLYKEICGYHERADLIGPCFIAICHQEQVVYFTDCLSN